MKTTPERRLKFSGIMSPLETSKSLMNRSLRSLLHVTLALAVTVAPVPARAGASSDALLELASQRGPALSLGFGVAPIHWEFLSLSDVVPGPKPAESVRLADLEPRGQAVSFDVKLRWPGMEPTSPLEPYLVFGPAVFVDRLSDVGLAGMHPDPVVRLGVRAGAGFTWRIGRDTTLFGSYDFTSTELTSPAARTPGSGGIDGYDILYGVRFRY
jgi:hypothetical protein